jgi:hypothetical protein
MTTIPQVVLLLVITWSTSADTMPKSYTGQLIDAFYNSTSFGHVDLNRNKVKQVQKTGF